MYQTHRIFAYMFKVCLHCNFVSYANHMSIGVICGRYLECWGRDISPFFSIPPFFVRHTSSNHYFLIIFAEKGRNSKGVESKWEGRIPRYLLRTITSQNDFSALEALICSDMSVKYANVFIVFPCCFSYLCWRAFISFA